MANLTPSESAAFFEHVFSASKDAFVGVDSSGLISLFNPAAERLFRIPAESAAGDAFVNLLIENQRAAFKKVIDKFFEKGTKPLDRTAVEVTAVRGQGSSIRCEFYITSFSVRERMFLGVFIKDVTERKRSAQKLYEAQKMEILDKFAGDVAHEINNLLVGIQGHASLVKYSDSNDERDYSASEIEKLVKKGAEIVKELRAFARAGGNRDKSPRSVVDFNLCVRNVAQMIGRTAPRNIDLRVQTDETLPKILAAQEQIEEAITAVCLNALDAMPAGGTLTLETSSFTPDDLLIQTHPGMPSGRLARLIVLDRGIGMDPDTIRRAFEPFFTTRESQGRSGLGLTMAYKTMKDHGGYIAIESEKGAGTSVQMYLPMAASDSALVEIAPEEKIVPGTATLLLVDDEPSVLETTSKLLEEIGYTVHSAKDGLEALKIFDARKNEIDAVVIDMKMPGKTGLETFQEMKKIKPEVKAILTTGYSIRGDTDAMFRLGLRAFILKPYTLAELSTKINMVLTSS